MQTHCCEVKPIINIALSKIIVPTSISFKIPNKYLQRLKWNLKTTIRTIFCVIFEFIWAWQWQWTCSWNLWSYILASCKSKLRLDRWKTKWNYLDNLSCRPSVINFIQIRPLLSLQKYSNRESRADTIFQWHTSFTERTRVEQYIRNY